MKNLILAFAMLTTFSTIALHAEIKSKTGDFPAKEMKSQNEQIVKMVVDEISRGLPQTVDKYTSFTKIENKGLTLIYTYEINTGAKNDKTVIKESKDRMQKTITKGICQSSKRFLDSQINISYKYINAKTKAFLFQFDVTQKDCLKFYN